MDKYVITAACVECGVCENRCPSGAITEGSNKYVITSHCTGCGICINVCPVNAIVKKIRKMCVHPTGNSLKKRSVCCGPVVMTP